MRTLLKHGPTGQYFRGLDDWTSDPEEAFDFENIARALRFAKKAGFADVELILAFDEPVEYARVREKELRVALDSGPATAWSRN